MHRRPHDLARVHLLEGRGVRDVAGRWALRDPGGPRSSEGAGADTRAQFVRAVRARGRAGLSRERLRSGCGKRAGAGAGPRAGAGSVGEEGRALGRAAKGPGSCPGRSKKEEGMGWELGQNGPAGLVWFSISFSFLFPFLFHTNSNLIEFK